MALSRKFLAAMGIEEDKIDEIVKAHSETVTALKEEAEKYKEKADKFDKAQEELTAANKKIEDLSKNDTYKVKYDALKEDFDEYRKNVDAEKAKTTKTAAYKSLLKSIGISEKRIDAITKLAELDKIELDKDGNIEGSDELKKSLAEEWSDFIVKDGKEGANTSTPPANNGGTKKTREEIMKIKDTAERQKAWAEYIQNGGN